MKTHILIPALLLFSALANGQEILEEYIRYGLENNLSLKQREADYRKSLEALHEARALFYPEISFQSRYTRSEGDVL
jgi:outer membrane protein